MTWIDDLGGLIRIGQMIVRQLEAHLGGMYRIDNPEEGPLFGKARFVMTDVSEPADVPFVGQALVAKLHETQIPWRMLRLSESYGVGSEVVVASSDTHSVRLGRIRQGAADVLRVEIGAERLILPENT